VGYLFDGEDGGEGSVELFFPAGGEGVGEGDRTAGGRHGKAELQGRRDGGRMEGGQERDEGNDRGKDESHRQERAEVEMGSWAGRVSSRCERGGDKLRKSLMDQ